MTARELITAALRLIGAKGSGDGLDSTEESEHIVTLNDLLESLANKGIVIPSRTIETVSWASGSASRTIGASGNIVTTRPLKIESAFYRDANNIDTPIEVITAAEYADIPDKSTQGLPPEYLFYNPTATNGTLYIWPVPSATATIGLQTLKPFTSVAIGDTLAMNPGYNKMLRFNLAIELAPEYGKSASAEVFAIAEQTLSDLYAANLKVPMVGFDGGIPGVGDGGFNVNTGDW